MKTIGRKILLGFLIAGLIPMLTLSYIAEQVAAESIEEITHQEFSAIRDIKKHQIESFFHRSRSDINILEHTVKSFYEEPKGIKGAINGHKENGKNFFEHYIEEYGYHDLFLISPDGQIFYSVHKGSDYQTNLLTGKYKETHLAELFRDVRQHEEATFTDFKPYAPADDTPAIFIAKRITDSHENLLGVIALEIETAVINKIMQERSGMGETGESYLIGSDLLMRSDSVLDPKTHSVYESFHNPEHGNVDTDAAKRALAGETAVDEVMDYHGRLVVSAFSPIEIEGLHWAILSEIEVDEAFSSIEHLKNIEIIASVITAILLVLFGLYFSRQLSAPIISLTKTMNEVGSQFNFSQKSTVQTQDEIGQAATAFNALLQNTSQAISEVNNTMSDIALGQFDGRISADLKGDLGVLKNNVNASADSVEFTMNALGEVMTALSNGDFSARMDPKIPGEFRNTVDSAMEGMDTAVSEIGNVVTKLSKGEFDGRITTELKGDMDKLKANINQSVEQLESGMTEMINAIVAQSHGDLTAQVTGQFQGELDRLKVAFNEGASKLSIAISNVMQSSNNVNNSSQELASASSDLNQRTQSQAASLEETASAMEELTSTIKNNTENAQQADQLSNNSRNQAKQGQDVMQETIQAITEIGESSQHIQEIISLIDSIAFQTNLLALNAAVEAARAGEHGRGFAVVAGEVRNLAGKSADAAKDIKSLIDRSAQSIKVGSDKIEQTNDVLEQITNSIQEVSSIVSEISAASQEQQEGVEQVNLAITQIDQTTQQNAALVEETTASAESLNNESDQLKSAVSGFKTGGNTLPN